MTKKEKRQWWWLREKSWPVKIERRTLPEAGHRTCRHSICQGGTDCKHSHQRWDQGRHHPRSLARPDLDADVRTRTWTNSRSWSVRQTNVVRCVFARVAVDHFRSTRNWKCSYLVARRPPSVVWRVFAVNRVESIWSFPVQSPACRQIWLLFCNKLQLRVIGCAEWKSCGQAAVDGQRHALGAKLTDGQGCCRWRRSKEQSMTWANRVAKRNETNCQNRRSRKMKNRSCRANPNDEPNRCAVEVAADAVGGAGDGIGGVVACDVRPPSADNVGCCWSRQVNVRRQSYEFWEVQHSCCWRRWSNCRVDQRSKKRRWKRIEKKAREWKEWVHSRRMPTRRYLPNCRPNCCLL